MPLTLMDRIRIEARDREFRMAAPRIRMLAPLAGIRNPYLPVEDRLRSIFIHIPKSAGTSIRTHVYDTHSFHVPAIRYKAFDRKKFESCFKFTFVRNPWARLFSAYRYLEKRKTADQSFPDHRWAATYLSGIDGFEPFVLRLQDRRFRSEVKKYIHFRDQMDWISESGGERPVIVDHIGRYETLEADFAAIAARLGVSASLPALRVGGGEDYRRAFSPRMADIAAEVYADDIRALGYGFE